MDDGEFKESFDHTLNEYMGHVLGLPSIVYLQNIKNSGIYRSRRHNRNVT